MAAAAAAAAVEEEGAVVPEGSGEGLTADEAEQYDRQIRLWGLDAQKRLRSSRVLIVGVAGLGAEVSKNIVLAGVQEVVLLDHTSLESVDSACRFLMQKDEANRAEQAVLRLRTLNPNVLISADTGRLEEKDSEFLSKFDVIVVTGSTTQQLVKIDEVCREKQTKFFCGDVWGYYGYFFTDLGEHEYAIEVQKKESEDIVTLDGPKSKKSKVEEDTITVKETCSFCSLAQALDTDWSKKPAKYFRHTPPTYLLIHCLQLFRDREGHNPTASTSDCETLQQIKTEVLGKYNLPSALISQDFSRLCVSELSPVCAVVGGVLAQEVIKAISGKDRPYTNCFLYNGQQSSGIIELLQP